MLKSNPPQNDIAFTNAMLEAEGFEPEYVERKFFRDVYAVVAQAFDDHQEIE